uniref:Uncharacterized protein n=1 Tax=uncultured Leeuwenhoekiella sp. TaxID=487010 RepID=F4MNC6_9FLAO|nr:hypothetical protein [uncultured bacterium]CBL88161.1 hypothetical protein S18_1087_0006 [uncultured Leeuwenhoekiella sp.]
MEIFSSRPAGQKFRTIWLKANCQFQGKDFPLCNFSMGRVIGESQKMDTPA